MVCYLLIFIGQAATVDVKELALWTFNWNVAKSFEGNFLISLRNMHKDKILKYRRNMCRFM